jgi:large-conductance mechanosensitive channel
MNGLLAQAAGESPAIYLGWGDFVIQLGNFVVIVVMLVLFVLALVLPFPAAKRRK